MAGLKLSLKHEKSPFGFGGAGGLGPLVGAVRPAGPDYFGFYLLKIPDFTWVEGATVQGEFKRYTGVLNTDNSRSPVFVADGRDPVPLSLNQASALALSAGSKKPFDLVGVEGKSQDPGDTAALFFVPFYAEVDGQRINLIPTMTDSSSPSGSGPKPGPQAGPGGKFRY